MEWQFKDATSGHYYTIGARAEMTDVERQMGQRQWFTMDDSQLKAADMSILSGEIKETVFERECT